MVGGNTRRAGAVAAASVGALENMVERLPEDHRTAKRLAGGLNAIDASINLRGPGETKQVRASVRASGRKAAEWSAEMKQRGVLVSPCATWDLRFVTHRHIGDAEVDQALNTFRAIWNRK